ncbi:CHAP domain-containing protein [Geodermatophilus sp. DSM 44513]|uniref:CHAP domain-containing protein n=1 Tax=Geodermatophilus sp. DSM 44513 TaxID=1528104 RepID=UPI001271FD8D
MRNAVPCRSSSARAGTLLRRVGLLRQLVVSLAALAVVLIGVILAPIAQGTTGFIGSYCHDRGYACVTGGYAATAASTGNSWAWRYYGEQGAGGIGTPSGPHNCTLYVAWRLQQAGMVDPKRAWGNASEWGNVFSSDRRPAVGSVAWWKSGNHVAYVEQVSADGAQVYVRADNYVPSGAGGYTDAGWISVNAPTGFLHIHDVGAGAPGGSVTTPTAGIAFEANTSHLWTAGGAGTADRGLGMMPGTSPAIAAVSGGYQVAFQANTGNLWTTGPLGTRDFGLGMMAGTSPAIAAVPGGYQIAFQANTGNLWVAGTQGTGDFHLGMMRGTSPAIASHNGGYGIAFQANTGNLWTAGAAGTADRGLGMMAGTSPAIAANSAGYGIAFQANTGNLWTTGAGGTADRGLGMMRGTSPSIAAGAGGFGIAFQSNTGNLWTTGAAGTADLQLGMMARTSPSIAGGSSYSLAFQANTGSLWTAGGVGTTDLRLGMAGGTSPAIA